MCIRDRFLHRVGWNLHRHPRCQRRVARGVGLIRALDAVPCDNLVNILAADTRPLYRLGHDDTRKLISSQVLQTTAESGDGSTARADNYNFLAATIHLSSPVAESY